MLRLTVVSFPGELHHDAFRLREDPEVTNRLIQQALYFLGVGPRKHAFDRRLVGRGD